MPFSLRVILEPGVRAVDVDDEVEAEAVDEVELSACRLLPAADELDAAANELLDEAVTCCPAGISDGTFKFVGADAANISTESTLRDEEDEAKLRAPALAAVVVFGVLMLCDKFEFNFLQQI